MNWEEFFEAASEIAGHTAKYAALSYLCKLPRDESASFITQVVQTFPSNQLDDFEREFLRYAHSQFSADLRIRAMELYAWLKLEEYVAYGKFRGFVTGSNAIE